MKFKEQITYDLNSDQFKYLKREENRTLHRVDINELNKKLNEDRKNNFYTNALVIALSGFFLAILCIIGLKF